jgi:hypothetical protein
MNKKGRTRRIIHEAVVAYAAANPSVVQFAIAALFGTSQSRVSAILSAAGLHGIKRGAPLKLKPGQSAEEFDWEKTLHDAGLGMERGLRLSGMRILYGYDPMKESLNDTSATANQILNPFRETA